MGETRAAAIWGRGQRGECLLILFAQVLLDSESVLRLLSRFPIQPGNTIANATRRPSLASTL